MGCQIGNNPVNCMYAGLYRNCVGCYFKIQEMVEGSYNPGHAWYNQEPKEDATTKAPIPVDARFDAGSHTLCQFAGNQLSPEKDKQCGNYESSSNDKNRCMYYRKELGWCDCTLK